MSETVSDLVTFNNFTITFTHLIDFSISYLQSCSCPKDRLHQLPNDLIDLV